MKLSQFYIPLLQIDPPLLNAEQIERLGNFAPEQYLYTTIALGISLIALLIGMYFRAQRSLEKSNERHFKSLTDFVTESKEREAKDV